MGARKLFKAWRSSGPDGSPGSWHFREMARMRGRPVYSSTTFQPSGLFVIGYPNHSQRYCIYPRMWELIEIMYAEAVV
jgi:hypothetical protein